MVGAAGPPTADEPAGGRQDSNLGRLWRLYPPAAGSDLLKKNGRGDCRNFEPSSVLAPLARPFLARPEAFILDADRLAQRSA